MFNGISEEDFRHIKVLHLQGKWPFPMPGQIKRAGNEHDRAVVEHKQAKADEEAWAEESRKSLGDALF